MCNFKNGFILCKCDDTDAATSNTEEKNIEYIWTLYRYLGKSSKNVRGKYMMPQSEIGAGLTGDFVLQALNDRNCFDFDYQPSEGDNLKITAENQYKRLEFIFRKGNWVEDHYVPFDTLKEEIEKGKLAKR